MTSKDIRDNPAPDLAVPRCCTRGWYARAARRPYCTRLPCFPMKILMRPPILDVNKDRRSFFTPLVRGVFPERDRLVPSLADPNANFPASCPFPAAARRAGLTGGGEYPIARQACRARLPIPARSMARIRCAPSALARAIMRSTSSGRRSPSICCSSTPTGSA